MKTKAEFRKTLMEGYLAARPVGDKGKFQNFHGDVIFMLGRCLSDMAIGCQNRSWPELFALVQSQFDGTEDELTEQIRQFHLKVAEFIKAADMDAEAPEEQLVDETLFETFDRIGWKDVPIEARTAWLAMLGLHHLARVWVVSRQRLEHGAEPGATIDIVAQSAGNLFRQYDQKVNSQSEGADTLIEAVRYAKMCGLTRSEIMGQIEATLDSDVVPRAINPSKFVGMDAASKES